MIRGCAVADPLVFERPESVRTAWRDLRLRPGTAIRRLRARGPGRGELPEPLIRVQDLPRREGLPGPSALLRSTRLSGARHLRRRARLSARESPLLSACHTGSESVLCGKAEGTDASSRPRPVSTSVDWMDAPQTPPLREVLNLRRILGRTLCVLGLHDFRLVERILTFGSEGGVERVRCTRCGLTITRHGRPVG